MSFTDEIISNPAKYAAPCWMFAYELIPFYNEFMTKK